MAKKRNIEVSLELVITYAIKKAAWVERLGVCLMGYDTLA
jgi:hypothetical protein